MSSWIEDINKWASHVGLTNINASGESDKMKWAIDIICNKSELISAMPLDQICDLLMIANSWHVFLRKELGKEKAKLQYLRDTSSWGDIYKATLMKVETLAETCQGIRQQIDSLKSVYINRSYEKRNR